MSTAAAALMLLLVALSAPTTAESQTISPECPASCSGVDIPYPFGIGAPGCFREGFEIICSNNGTDLPVLANTSTPVVQLSVNPHFSQVMLPIGYQCYNVSPPSSNNKTKVAMNSTSNARTNIMSIIDGVYRISNKNNTLVVLGCATIAVVKNINDMQLYGASGCMSFCRDSKATEDGNCKVDILPEFNGTVAFEFLMTARLGRGQVLAYSPCDYAFLVATNNYTFQKSDLLSMETSRTMPVNLDWAIRDSSCSDAPNPKYAFPTDAQFGEENGAVTALAL